MSLETSSISLDSDPQVVLAYLVDTYFSSRREEVEDFLQEPTTQARFEPHSFDELEGLLDDEEFKTRFASQWHRNTDTSNFPGRDVNTALSETILHSLTAIASDAQIDLIPGEPDEVKSFYTRAQILSAYFTKAMPDGGDPTSGV